MTWFQLLLFVLIIQVIHGLSTWKLYVKANKKASDAFIPIYNGIQLMDIINRPKWWIILLFIPVVNLIMFPVIWVETLRSYGKISTTDTLLGIFTFGLYVTYVNYFEDVKHRPERSTKAPNEAGETLSSIVFGVIVATIIHTYAIQPFTIPTSSLEKTLLVGDFLFVSKLNYGARTPQTPIALPMVHDTIPLIKTKSYLSKPQLPKFRFPGFQKPEYNDIVVFNWPADTVYQFFDKSKRHASKPLDKRSNYVKRLVGKPGDDFSIKNGVVYVNGKILDLGDRAKIQYGYYVDVEPGTHLDAQKLFFEMNIDKNSVGQISENKLIFQSLTDENVAILSKMKGIKNIEKINNVGIEYSRDYKKAIFPHNQNWSADNLGPLHIPAKGEIVTLTTETLPLYKRIIEVYEGNDLKVENGKIYINGHLTTQYQIQQDYYYMMGDNRHASEDSRYWGFVPEDHILGTPVLIWMSLDGQKEKLFDKIRWERLFTTVHGSGKPRSYGIIVLIGLVAWAGYSFVKWRKNKKGYYN